MNNVQKLAKHALEEKDVKLAKKVLAYYENLANDEEAHSFMSSLSKLYTKATPLYKAAKSYYDEIVKHDQLSKKLHLASDLAMDFNKILKGITDFQIGCRDELNEFYKDDTKRREKEGK